MATPEPATTVNVTSGTSAPVQPVLFEPPALAPAPAPERSAAEIENELLKAQLASRNKDADLHKSKEATRKLEEQLAASRKALQAAGVITGDDPSDAKAILEKQERDTRLKERRDAAIERAALKRLIPTGLGEYDAELVLGSLLRAPGIAWDDATGTVSGIDEAFAAMKPTIERLSGKSGTTPPAAAPPIPPAPSNSAMPMDTEFQNVKTGKDFMLLPASKHDAFATKYPDVAKRLEAEFLRNTQKGVNATFAPAVTVARR